jgi:hypothetical protein
MNKILSYIGASFDTTKEGASARKLTAFWFVMLTTYIEIKHVDKESIVMISCIDVAAAFLCLSIISITDIINLRSGNTTVSKQEITIKDTKTESPTQ